MKPDFGRVPLWNMEMGIKWAIGIWPISKSFATLRMTQDRQFRRRVYGPGFLPFCDWCPRHLAPVASWAWAAEAAV